MIKQPPPGHGPTVTRSGSRCMSNQWGLGAGVNTPPCPSAGGLKSLPAYKVPFHLVNGQESTLWFPGIPTGTTWNVTITCELGGLNNSQVLY